MERKKSHIIVLLVLFIPLVTVFQGCHHRPEVSFDTEAWKDDRNGCEGKRLNIYEELIVQKNELLGLSSNQISNLLGKPDLNELYRRNQKFFIYRISPGKSCNEINNRSWRPLFLVFRFNALGLATEVYLNDKADPTK